ncbi:MAG: SWIM zinc finger family protein [Desulfomicrobium sp.]|nr:SWIM zinc finger family protein [Desulfomicrobium sp.]
MSNLEQLIRKMTMNDLNAWAGKAIVGRGKGYIGRVQELSRLEDGTLAAWVRGTLTYSTSVHIQEDGEHGWTCTCPYPGGVCKHAVAVILAAAARIKAKEEIPLLDEDEELFFAILDMGDEDEWPDDWPEEDDDEPRGHTQSPLTEAEGSLRKRLSAKSKSELVNIILELNENNPELIRLLRDKELLDKGDIQKIVRSLRSRITKLSSEPAWYNHWDHEGHSPDYEPVLRQFRTLLENGHADVVVSLGEHLWDRCQEQIEHSDDEGDTANSIGRCLDVVLEALPLSGLTPIARALWFLDRSLKDDYEILGPADKFLDGLHLSQAQWREVAELLDAKLEGLPRSGRGIGREKLTGWLIMALEEGGWGDRVVPFLEKEVPHTQDYGRLVDVLMDAGQIEKARQCCVEGFGKTCKESPGIASGLHKRLRSLAVSSGMPELAAAYLADTFFKQPNIAGFKDTREAAEKLGCWEAVRACLLKHLQTGKRPDTSVMDTADAWPLPRPEVSWPLSGTGHWRTQFPLFSLLIDIAILENRLDDAVRLNAERPRNRYSSVDMDMDLTVAQAVSTSHPQVALDIWRRKVESLIAQVKPKAYETAAGYLTQMRKVFQATKRMDEWKALLADLRKRHKPKRRLMEELDLLEKPVRLV